MYCSFLYHEIFEYFLSKGTKITSTYLVGLDSARRAKRFNSNLEIASN